MVYSERCAATNLPRVQGICFSNYFRCNPIKQDNEVNKIHYKPKKTFMTFDYLKQARSSVYYWTLGSLKLKRIGYHYLVNQFSREIRYGRVKLLQAAIAHNNYANYLPSIEILFKWLDMFGSGKRCNIDNKPSKELDAYLSCKNNKLTFGDELEKFCGHGNEPMKHFIEFGKAN